MPSVPGAPQKRKASTKRATHTADALAKLGDHISAAQRIAEAEGEPLLAFLLAMACEERDIATRRRLAGKPAAAQATRQAVP